MTDIDTSAEAAELFAEWADRGVDKELAEFIRALRAERDQLQAQVEKADEMAEAASKLMDQCEDGDGFTEGTAVALDCGIAAYRKARGEG